MKIDIIYFGTPDFSASVLKKIIRDKRFSVKAVVTNPDKPVGRKHVLTQSPVAQLATKHHIPVLKPDKLDDEFLAHFAKRAWLRQAGQLLTTDFFIVFSYGKIIPQKVLDIPKYGSLNIHPSLLPRYRGPSPIQTAILHGDKKSGITIILMDQKMDHGPVLSTKEISLSEKDTFASLSKKMAQVGSSLIVATLIKFLQGKIKPKAQDHSKAIYVNMVKKNDGYFDINQPPHQLILDRMIRAYFPWPTVWTRWHGKVVKLLPENLIQMEGKKPMSLKDFLNGYPNFPIRI